MIDIACELLPYWDPAGELGGYKMLVAETRRGAEYIGPSNAALWSKSSIIHNTLFLVDIHEWLESFEGPGSAAETRRLICYDCSILSSLIIPELLLHGYTQTDSWTPKKGTFFLLEDENTTHTLVFRTMDHGTEVRLVSLRAYLRSRSLSDLAAKTIQEKFIPDLPVEPWGHPTMEGLAACKIRTHAILEIWEKMFSSGMVWESTGRTLSAGGIAWSNFKRKVKKETGEQIWKILYPDMTPDEILEARSVFEDLLRPGNRGGFCYARTGQYSAVTGYDLNSAYGSALCDYIPYGPLLVEPPPEGPYFKLVWPVGIFVIKQGMLPIMSWQTAAECARHHFECNAGPREKVTDFMLSGDLPFFEDEWNALMQFYEPLGEVTYDKTLYFAAMKWGILQEHIHMLYDYSLKIPDSQLYYKMQIVQFYGKISQHAEAINVQYKLLEDRIQRELILCSIQSQHLGLGMYITAWCRIKIMQELYQLRQEDVVYVDTDQIYVLDNRDAAYTIDVGPHLGSWKKEEIADKMIVTGSKTYQILREDGSVKTVAASLPAEIVRTLQFGELDGRDYPGYIYRRNQKYGWQILPEPHIFRVVTKDASEDAISFVIPDEIERLNNVFSGKE